jgi:hypothetical protein
MKMGYRSDVAITAYGDKTKLAELKAFYDTEVEKLSKDDVKNLEYLINASVNHSIRNIWDEQTGEFFFYASHVKWYDGYPTVDLLNGVFAKAEVLGLSAECIRVGEELEDNDEYYIDGDNGCDYRMSVTRSISF